MEYYGCSSLAQFQLVFGDFAKENASAVALCCEAPQPGIPFRKTAKETLDELIGMRTRLVIKGGVELDTNSPCTKCCYYAKKAWGFSLQISQINLAMTPTSCQCKCFYCTQREGISTGWDKDAAVISAYEKAFDLLRLAKADNVISPDVSWMVASGEITIHPFRKQMLELVKGHPVSFYTNGFIFDEAIAKELHDNPRAFMNISLDAGTAETWRKIKGVNNFSHVIDNLKRYSRVAYYPQQITLKYIVFPGINDSDEDFLSFVELEKSLHISAFNIPRDNRVFHDNAPSDIDDSKLIESAARFAVIQYTLGGKVSFSNFTDEERRQIVALAEKILSRV